MASPPQKISLYDLSALKSQTDDHIPELLTSLPPPYKFTPSHYYTNVRLALGYLAVTIAAALFYADWKLGWSDTKAWTLPACVAYFALNGALTLWIWFVEKGKIFVGTREGGQTLTLASSVRKFDPTYNLHVTYTAPSGKPFVVPADTISAPFSEFFNMHGFLDKKAFRRWLAGNLEVVGMADPVARKEWLERDAVEEADEEIISSGAVRAMGGEAGTRRRKV